MLVSKPRYWRSTACSTLRTSSTGAAETAAAIWPTGDDCTLGMAITALTIAATLSAMARIRGAPIAFTIDCPSDRSELINYLPRRVRHALRETCEVRGVPVGDR